MRTAKRRRRVAPLSWTERALIVFIVGVAVWLGCDLYRRWHPTPAVGGLALRVFAPRGGSSPARSGPLLASPREGTSAAGRRAAEPRPQPPPEDPCKRQPTTYTPPSPSADVRARAARALHAEPPAAAAEGPIRLRFPSFEDMGREGGSLDPEKP